HYTILPQNILQRLSRLRHLEITNFIPDSNGGRTLSDSVSTHNFQSMRDAINSIVVSYCRTHIDAETFPHSITSNPSFVIELCARICLLEHPTSREVELLLKLATYKEE